MCGACYERMGIDMDVNEVQQLVSAKLAALSTNDKSTAPKENPVRSLDELCNISDSELSTALASGKNVLLPQDEQRLTQRTNKLRSELRRHVEDCPSSKDKSVMGSPIVVALTKLIEDANKEIVALERQSILRLRVVERADAQIQKLRQDLQKAGDQRQKLEKLCRELRNQNRGLLADAKRTAEEEVTKREELSKSFHTALEEISDKLKNYDVDRQQLDTENQRLRDQVVSIAEQYEIREQHFQKQLHAKDLEKQLAEAKLQQETELHKVEQAKAQVLEEQVKKLSVSDVELRKQLVDYGTKFEEFQSTLTQSNDVYKTFKKELETMSKRMKKMDKENAELKQTVNRRDIAILEATTQNQTLVAEKKAADARVQKLETLCRALQQQLKTARSTEDEQNDGAAEVHEGASQ